MMVPSRLNSITACDLVIAAACASAFRRFALLWNLNTEISLLVPEMEPMKTGVTIRFRTDERKGCKFRFSDSKAFALPGLSRHKNRKRCCGADDRPLGVDLGGVQTGGGISCKTRSVLLRGGAMSLTLYFHPLSSFCWK